MGGWYYIILLFIFVRFFTYIQFQSQPNRKFRTYNDGCQKRNESAIFMIMLSENSDLTVGLALYTRSYRPNSNRHKKQSAFCIDATK